jgi:hypothetical protein
MIRKPAPSLSATQLIMTAKHPASTPQRRSRRGLELTLGILIVAALLFGAAYLLFAPL